MDDMHVGADDVRVDEVEVRANLLYSVCWLLTWLLGIVPGEGVEQKVVAA